MPRRFFVGGNWKLNGSTESIKSHIDLVSSNAVPEGTDVLLAFPFVFLSPAADFAKEKGGKITVSAENVSDKDTGAFTGEVSADMLKDVGVNWTLVGHSERRDIYKETDEIISSKARNCLERGVNVVYCIGEHREEREGNTFEALLSKQMGFIVEAVDAAAKTIAERDGGEAAAASAKIWSENIVIAYEPVWAIGTGLTATPQQAQDTHAFLRKHLSTTSASQKGADEVRIIYGGSVKASNCKELGACSDVDGFLVGGASLKPEFVDIVNTRA